MTARSFGLALCWAASALTVQASSEPPPPTAESPAAALRARYAGLGERIEHSPFQRPLTLDSSESSGKLTGEIYARIDHPFGVVTTALGAPADWCEVLILPFNAKSCRAAGSAEDPHLQLRIGRKYDQPAEDAYPLDLSYRVKTLGADYFAVQLDADKGPFGTHDYRILLEVTALDEGRSALHLSYSSAFDLGGRLALQVYLATAGHDKVGFTVIGTHGNDEPAYIRGMRGLIERTTMRYYLAVDAHLGALSAPPEARFEKSLELWFDETEQYARQLHEMDRTAYLQMKRGEHSQAPQVP